MGKVTTHLTITNRLDEGLAERGLLPLERVRSINIEEALVDTGATTLCLPKKMIKQLGLSLLREVEVSTSAGIRRTRLFRDASVNLLGREGTFECVELPRSNVVLVGALPLEALGVEVDLKHQTLRLLPEDSANTHYTA